MVFEGVGFFVLLMRALWEKPVIKEMDGTVRFFRWGIGESWEVLVVPSPRGGGTLGQIPRT